MTHVLYSDVLFYSIRIIYNKNCGAHAMSVGASTVKKFVLGQNKYLNKIPALCGVGAPHPHMTQCLWDSKNCWHMWHCTVIIFMEERCLNDRR